MSDSRVNALIVTPTFATARLLEEKLNDNGRFAAITHVQWFSAALDRLRSTRFDVILLSLSVFDSRSSAVFESISQIAPAMPIVTVASAGEQNDAVHTLQLGADECVLLENLGKHSLSQTISNAIARKRMLNEIASAGLQDEETGFYNRTGFESAAQQYFGNCAKAGAKLWLIVARVRGATESLIRQFANTINLASKEFETLPPPCLARLGSAEFAIMVVQDSPAHLAAFMKRVESNGPVDWGAATYDAEYPSSPATLIDRARLLQCPLMSTPNGADKVSGAVLWNDVDINVSRQHWPMRRLY